MTSGDASGGSSCNMPGFGRMCARFRFSTNTLLLFVAFLCVGFADWYGRVRHQAELVAAAETLGVSIAFESTLPSQPILRQAALGLSWIAGDEAFRRVTSASLFPEGRTTAVHAYLLNELKTDEIAYYAGVLLREDEDLSDVEGMEEYEYTAWQRYGVEFFWRKRIPK